MLIIRESIPDALDLSAHLVTQRIVSNDYKSEMSSQLLSLLAGYMEWRYVGNYEKALLVLIEVGSVLCGKPDKEEHLWVQLRSLIDELPLSQDVIIEINEKVGIVWV